MKKYEQLTDEQLEVLIEEKLAAVEHLDPWYMMELERAKAEALSSGETMDSGEVLTVDGNPSSWTWIDTATYPMEYMQDYSAIVPDEGNQGYYCTTVDLIEDYAEDTLIYAGDVRQEQFEIQAKIDEKIQSISEYYGWDRFQRGCVSVYESEDMTDPDRVVKIELGWASIGTVSIEEAEAFVRILSEAIDQAKNFAYCPGFRVTYDEAEANYSPYGLADDVIDHDVVDDDDIIDYPEEGAEDSATFYVETEVASSVPRWWWLDSVMNMDRYNREEGIYKSEGLEAEAAAFEAISLVEDVEDDDLKRCDSETTAWATYERKLDDVARIVAYNETLQKWCLDDLMPKLSIKVTMYRSPNDGQEYDDVDMTVTTCDEVTGVELVADEARRYARQADDGIVDAMING